MTEQYGYDRYGNQTSRNSGGVLQQIDTDTATNRLSTGYTYDAAGNVKTGDGYTLSYDALGQAATKTYTATNTFNETYIYTAGDERIGVQTSNSTETSSWWYWSVRDEGGKVLRQYRSSALDPTQTALWIEDYVYRDGLLVGAERPPTLGGRRHFHLDHLGSPRLITSNDGQIVSTHDYLPFGGETTSVWQEEYAGFDREDPMKFTGHERDYAGGFGREDGHVIDYMHARYYNPAMGRFWAVDPIEGNPHNSQSWNRYIYANNTPMVATDLTGLVSSGSAWQWLPERCKLLCDEKKPKKKDPPPADDKTPHSHLSITVTGKDPGWFSAFFFRAGLRAARGYMGRSFTPAEEAALNGQNYAASLLMRGAKPRARILGGPVIIGPIGNFGSDVELVDGFYQVAGSELRFREFYYNRLWATGRPAPFLAAQEVLDTATNIEPDVSLPGFNRYTNGTLEMVYNPSTGEVFHLQPLR